jgi:protein gp37
MNLWVGIEMVLATSLNFVYGCEKVSPGCDHCYIDRPPFVFQTKRFGMKTPFEGKVGYFDEHRQVKKIESLPAGSVLIVNLLSDTFAEFIPDSKRDEWHSIFRKYSMYQFMLITKRTGLAMAYYRSRTVPDNVWVGTTVESGKYLPRIELLRKIDAKVRWISFQPLLEDLADFSLKGIHLASVGGESGRGRRPFDRQWARNILAICRRDKVAFNYLGSSGFDDDHLDGVQYDENPLDLV